MISTIEYARPATTSPTNAYIIVFRDFFIFSSSPVAITNPIPPHVIAITARTLVSRSAYLIIWAIAFSGDLLILGRILSQFGGTTETAKPGSIMKTERNTRTNDVKIRLDFFIYIELWEQASNKIHDSIR